MKGRGEERCEVLYYLEIRVQRLDSRGGLGVTNDVGGKKENMVKKE